MVQGRSAPSSNRTLPMSVANMTFMVDKLGEDCAPLQFVRELTQNAIESIRKSPGKKGELRWDVAWNHQTLTGQTKLAVIDNGVGILPENLARIFDHGFTTRKEGHGFGLHSGAIAAKQMGGSLTVQSAGPGKGAAFLLQLPFQPPAAKPR